MNRRASPEGSRCGYTSAAGPALGSLNGALFLGHGGDPGFLGDDGALFLDFKSPDPGNGGIVRAGKTHWGPVVNPNGEAVDNVPPSFAVLGNELFVAWTGTDDSINVARVSVPIGKVSQGLP